MQISATKPCSISGSDDCSHILSVVTLYGHVPWPLSTAPFYSHALLSLFIVTLCWCFLLPRSEVAPGETFFAASLPGADNHNARFGLRLNI